METHRGIPSGVYRGWDHRRVRWGSYARYHFFELHHPERIAGRMKERLRAELNLTPEQLAKISPIIDKTTVQLRDIRRDTGRRVHAIITDAHQQMAAQLTDEQRQKLTQIEERHRQWRHRRFHDDSDEAPSATP